MTDSSLYTKDEINTLLSNYLIELGYEGEILNILKSILVESVWLTQVSSGVVLKESNIMTATQLSSLLAVCHDNFVTVPRGNCQIIQLDNLICLKNTEIKAFTLANTIGKHKLYYMENKNYETNDTDISLKFYVAKDCVSYSNEDGLDRRLSSDNFILDIPGYNWSEDFLLYRNDQRIYNVDDVPISLHSEEEYYGNMFTKRANLVSPTVPYYIATTAPDYGIRIYSYNRFVLSDKYTFKGLVLLDNDQEDLDPNSIKNIQGFVFKDNTVDFINTDSVEPESNKTRLKLLCLSNFRDRNLISSNNALNEIVKLKLGDLFLGYKIQFINNKLLITYALKSGQYWTEAKRKEFVDEVEFNYKITEPIVFEQAPDKKVRLYLNIYYQSIINTIDIYDIINSFESKVGGEYSIDDVKAKIDKLDSIIKTEVIDNLNMRDEDKKCKLEEIRQDDEGNEYTIPCRLVFDTDYKEVNFISVRDV